MMVLARVAEKILGRCVHCLGIVTVTRLASVEAFLEFESTGLCQLCQEVRAAS